MKANLRELRNKLIALADEQGLFNNRLSDVQNTELTRPEAGDLQQRQRELTKRTRKIRNRIDPKQLQGLGKIRQQLSSAANAMQSAEKRVQPSGVGAAIPHGRRGEQKLMAAADTVRGLLRQLAAARLKGLADRSAQLGREQRQTARKTRSMVDKSPNDKKIKKIREKQENYKQKATSLMSRIRALGQEFDKRYPKAGKAVSRALRKAEKASVTGSMTRAGNALLYRRFKRAGKNQIDAANMLQNLSGDLEKAEDQLPRISRPELLRMLQKLRKRRKELQDSWDKSVAERRQKREELQKKTAQQLENLSEQLEAPKLRRMAGQLRVLSQADAPETAKAARAIQVLNQAAALLKRELSRQQLRSEFRLRRRTTEPPREYRQLIRKYFKSLSEGK